jgi:hypothetical protein
MDAKAACKDTLAQCRTMSPMDACVAFLPSGRDPGLRFSRIYGTICIVGKVIASKQPSTFAETPDETLAAIAPYLEEVPLRAEQTIVEG